MKAGLWQQWKRLARKAAEVQAHVVFFLLYFLLLVPLAFISGRRRSAVAASPRWEGRSPQSDDLADARRQY
jgi:hypothetical protein